MRVIRKAMIMFMLVLNMVFYGFNIEFRRSVWLNWRASSILELVMLFLVIGDIFILQFAYVKFVILILLILERENNKYIIYFIPNVNNLSNRIENMGTFHRESESRWCKIHEYNTDNYIINIGKNVFILDIYIR